MLVRFSVGNFLSFNETQTFSMIANRGQRFKERLFESDDMNLLKFSAIYGANASGKTNIVKAMEFARTCVVRRVTDEASFSYYRLDPSKKKAPSYFEFEMLINGALYSYGFEIILSEAAVTEEWLIRLDKLQDQILFTRNTHNGQFSFDTSLFATDQQKQRFEIYLNDIRKAQNTLFLREIITNKEAVYEDNEQALIFKRSFRWIDGLEISFPSTSISGYSCFTSTSAKEIEKAIKTFATGISEIKIEQVSQDKALKDAPEKFKREINRLLFEFMKKPNATNPPFEETPIIRIRGAGKLFLVSLKKNTPIFQEITFHHHKMQEARFSLGEESEGTQRLLDLLIILLAKKEHSVFVIDEFDRSLHPQLTLHFIKNFLELAKERNVQLIITTHESHLLDLSVLRQDEIWFVEKKESGQTHLIAFDRYKERFDKQIERAYLDGRYAGVPLFDHFFFPDTLKDKEQM